MSFPTQHPKYPCYNCDHWKESHENTENVILGTAGLGNNVGGRCWHKDCKCERYEQTYSYKEAHPALYEAVNSDDPDALRRFWDFGTVV